VSSESEQAKVILTTLMDEFEQDGVSISSLVRRASRVATLRRDFEDLVWLSLQAVDMNPLSGASKDAPTAAQAALGRLRSNMSSVLSAADIERLVKQQLEKHIQLRTMTFGSNAGNIKGDSLGQLEQQLVEMERIYQEVAPSPNLSAVDTFHAAKAADKARAEILPTTMDIKNILERVREAVWQYLMRTEAALQDGLSVSSVFTRAQDYINQALSKHAPEAAAAFVAAQERMADGNQEALSHALTSCRRVIKSLADALYPATGLSVVGTDGISRVMSDDMYKNRLIQFVQSEIGKHGQSNVVKSSIETLAVRLKALDALASKGVHDKVSADEAETCVVWTYLMAGDLLRIADGSSMLIKETLA
jgi:hypothetical protein